MGSRVGSGGKKPVDGARIPIRLAVGDIGAVSGKCWANPSVTDTGDGEVREW